ncbi:MAG: COX15/CtaA family protein [Alphaproteobacteria bacterium]
MEQNSPKAAAAQMPAHAGYADISHKTRTALRVWLYVMAVLIVLMVLLGGATRLTDSGLSITEWRPIVGLLPPLNEAEWFDRFIKYQGIPEYQLVNRGMTMDEFKSIYWWEWSHRFFGRLIGFAFALPLGYFALTRRLNARLGWWLATILVLGGLQGALGWFMVISGLTVRIDVSQYRLAAHLGLAVLILAALLWTAFDLGARANGQGDSKSAKTRALFLSAAVLLGLVFLQILAGGFVAGLNAGLIYNTWPLMDGRLVPDGLFDMTPAFLNMFENVLTVQFNHRLLAYLVLAAALAHLAVVYRAGRAGARQQGAALLAITVVAQIGLGIATLLGNVAIITALAHQVGALAVLALALHQLHLAHRLAAVPQI